LLGYEAANIFRVWNPSARRVDRVTHVDFDESNLIGSKTTNTGNWLVDSEEGEVTDELEAPELEAQMDPEAPSAQHLPYPYLIGTGDF